MIAVQIKPEEKRHVFVMGFAAAYFKGNQHMSKSQRGKKKDDKKKPAKTMKEKKLAKREKKAKKDNPGIPTA